MTILTLAFLAVLDVSIRVSAWVGLLWLARPLLRRRFGSGVVAALSLVLAVRLVCPLPLSLPGGPRPTAVPANQAAFSGAPTRPATIRASVSDAPLRPISGLAPARDHRWLRSGRALGSRLVLPGAILWLGGLVVGGLRLAHGAWQIRRWTARTRPVDAAAPVLWHVFLSLSPALRREVALHLTDEFAAPTLVGIVRPQIWFPRAWLERLDPVEMRHVLLHELGHARRRDLLAQTLGSLAVCLHWFNPLVWLLARGARTDRELACDAWVLAHLRREPAAPGDTAAYGHTLLKVIGGLRAGTSPCAPAGAVAMAADRRHLRLRVGEIGAFRPCPRRWGWLVLAVAVLGVTFSTAGQAPAPTDPPAAPLAGSFPASSPTPPSQNAPVRPSASPIPDDKLGLEIESKFVELSREAVVALQAESARGIFPASFTDQLVALATGKAVNVATPPDVFALSHLLTSRDFSRLVHVFNEQKGVDLLSAPRVTTRQGQRATVEITRDFVYPDGFTHARAKSGEPKLAASHYDHKKTGVSVAADGIVSPERDAIDLHVSWQITDFKGFVAKHGQPGSPEPAAADQNFPVFSTQSMETMVTLAPDETLVLAVPRNFIVPERQRETADEPKATPMGSPEEADHIPVVDPSKKITGQAVLLIFVTVHLAEIVPPPPEGRPTPPGIPASSDATPAPSPVADPSPLPETGPGGYPYGKPVPGKPGFVTSPYAPDAGYVDLTGFERDQEVRDPYSQKIFLVP